MKDSEIVAVLAAILHADRRPPARLPAHDKKALMEYHVDLAWDLFMTTRYREGAAHKRNPAEPYMAS